VTFAKRDMSFFVVQARNEYRIKLGLPECQRRFAKIPAILSTATDLGCMRMRMFWHRILELHFLKRTLFWQCIYFSS